MYLISHFFLTFLFYGNLSKSVYPVYRNLSKSVYPKIVYL